MRPQQQLVDRAQLEGKIFQFKLFLFVAGLVNPNSNEINRGVALANCKNSGVGMTCNDVPCSHTLPCCCGNHSMWSLYCSRPRCGPCQRWTLMQQSGPLRARTVPQLANWPTVQPWPVYQSNGSPVPHRRFKTLCFLWPGLS